ncbi:hypothetical protein D3C87_1602310 [compost metagenome]
MVAAAASNAVRFLIVVCSVLYLVTKSCTALLATEVSASSFRVMGLSVSVVSARFSVMPSMAVEILFEPLLTGMPLMMTSASFPAVAVMPEVTPLASVLNVRMSFSDWSPLTVMDFTAAFSPVSREVSIR